jgi:hypothetical protein
VKFGICGTPRPIPHGHRRITVYMYACVSIYMHNETFMDEVMLVICLHMVWGRWGWELVDL